MLPDAPRWWCAECRCAHEPNHDIAGLCFQAEAWRESHEHYQSDLDNHCYGEWWDYGMQRHDLMTYPINKVINGCGHMTFERHSVPMAWCPSCRDRLSEERYNKGVI